MILGENGRFLFPALTDKHRTGPISFRDRPCFYFVCRLGKIRLGQVAVNKIQNILPVHAEHAASAGTVTVDAKGGYTRYNIAVTQKIGAAGIAEAGTAGGVIVGQQH